MNSPLRNIDLVKTVIQVLKGLRVQDVIVCAGARNIPLLQGLDWQVEHANAKDGFHIESYFEERSAAFYAMGRAKVSGHPVAIVTTSGTAVAELFPAVIEAYYQNIPLLVITADRPKNFRGSGSPQSIDQAHLFKKYVEASLDWDIFQTDFSFSSNGKKPIHLNLCFDEPLLDGDFADAKAMDFKVHRQALEAISHSESQSRPTCLNPLVIVSDIRESERSLVVNFIKQNNLFVYPEFLSGLLNHPDLKMYHLTNLDGFADLQKKYGFQSIIRIGGIPTHRLWRDLENKYMDIAVLNFSDREFSGLARTSTTYSLSQLKNLNIVHQERPEIIHHRNVQLEEIKQMSLQLHKNSEPAFVQKLAQMIQQDPLYIGNSLPIREWDLFSDRPQANQQVWANRGANGIDGQISSYLGWSHQMPISWCLIGDLTALYDLAALGLNQHSPIHKKRIVIMNNLGGKIFNRVFGDKKYLNTQAVDFSAWAKLWGWDYVYVSQNTEIEPLRRLEKNKVIIELAPDNRQSDQFWLEWDFACKH